MVIKLDEQNFDEIVLKATKPVLVDLYADWCGPCKMMAPVVEQIAEEKAEQAIVCKLNVDENMQLAAKYQVMNIPTFLIFKDGVLVDRVIGGTTKAALAEKL